MTTLCVPIDRLVPDPTQPRRSVPPDDLARLAASLRARGQLQPLRVKPADAAGRHAVVSGHRRLAALTMNGAAHADCVVVDAPQDEAETLAEQLAENLLREDLSPVEEAEGYRRYLALTGLPAARAAEALHVPPPRLSRRLALLDLSAEVRDKVHAGDLAPDTAYHVARLPAGVERDRLLAEAAAGTLSRDAAASAAKAARKPQSTPAESPAPGRVTCKLPGGRSLSVTASSVGLATLIDALEEVLKEARKARQQGLDVTTLSKVLRDRAANGGAA